MDCTNLHKVPLNVEYSPIRQNKKTYQTDFSADRSLFVFTILNRMALWDFNTDYVALEIENLLSN